jgi:hypothetical protein
MLGIVQIRELAAVASQVCPAQKSNGLTDCDCLTLVWCLQRQNTPVIMLPIDAKMETMPAALEVASISGTARRPTVALQGLVGLNNSQTRATYRYTVLTIRARWPFRPSISLQEDDERCTTLTMRRKS